MDNQTPYTWLMDNGSPAIRVRTGRDLMKEKPSADMVADLLSSQTVQYWQSQLQPPTDLNSVHGSKPSCLENICGKLRACGFEIGMDTEWRNRLSVFSDFLQSNQNDPHGLSPFTNWYIYLPLVTLGYLEDTIVESALRRLETVAGFCRSSRYDIHIDPSTFGKMPAAFQGRPLIDPDLNYCLPTIWDLYALAYFPSQMQTPVFLQVKNTIIEYILTDQYQHLPEGYGIMYHAPNKRYYAYGWEISLPGWFGFDFKRSLHKASFIQRLELMSNFQMARSTQWFQNSLNHLETFTTEQGTYRFPSSYLQEGNSGYYVTGAYQRLEDNRRRTIALELDSTFRMELLKKRSENTK